MELKYLNNCKQKTYKYGYDPAKSFSFNKTKGRERSSLLVILVELAGEGCAINGGYPF